METNYSLAIGNFDGFHLGHAKIIKELQNSCNNANIVTFKSHPLVTKKIKTNYEITPFKHKLEILSQHGFKNPLVYDFNEVSNLSAEGFIKNHLLKQVNLTHLVFGQDFKMGKDKQDAQSIKQIANSLGISCNVVERDKRYSSTIVRNLLWQGKVKEANSVLGRNFCINGKVVKGKGLGSTIGFATANIELDNYIIPLLGVYQVVLTNKTLNTKHNAICNIGVRPTVDNSKKVLLEVHIFDFSEDICNNIVSVEFINFIRQEKKFQSLDDLIKQIDLDCKEVQNIFAKGV